MLCSAAYIGCIACVHYAHLGGLLVFKMGAERRGTAMKQCI